MRSKIPLTQPCISLAVRLKGFFSAADLDVDVNMMATNDILINEISIVY